MATSLTNKIFVLVAAIFVIVEMAAAANYTVGGANGGWSLGTNSSVWASAISFKIGDNLVFQYDKSQHDVLEVSKSNYESCNAAGPIKTYTSGDDVIPLTTEGSRYFICGVPSHCGLGMKLQIDTAAATSTTPAPESGSPGGPPPPSTASVRSLQGKAAAAGLIAVGVMMMLLAL